MDYMWNRLGIVALAGMIIAGLVVKDIQRALVIDQTKSRFNLLLIEPNRGVSFVTYDPVERIMVALPFSHGTAITNRNSGEYDIDSLYKLGSYQGPGGMFARQKIQGFMRIPIPGYLVVEGGTAKTKNQLKRGIWQAIWKGEQTNLAKVDLLLLWYRTRRYEFREIGEEELIRSASLEKQGDRLIYHFDRLQEYVGKRFFDWQLGGENVTVAVINESGEDGLGSDMADFLTNMGMDVVMVRTGSGGTKIDSHWQIGDKARARKLEDVFVGLFELGPAIMEKVPDEYRAEVLVVVGSDAKELF